MKQRTRAPRHLLALSALAVALQALPPLALAASGDTHAYAIQAGSLSQALSRFAAEARITVQYAPELTQGLQSAGLSGEYAVEDGLAALLKGSGLQAVRRGDGVYGLQRTDGALALDATTVTGQALGDTTEGTGSYTTGATSTATPLNLSLRETPQSVSVMTRQRMDDQKLNRLTDVLEQTPGINVAYSGMDRFDIYSRGSTITNYQIDGITTISDSQTRTIPQTAMDMALYDHVEVLRGAPGLMVGAGDPGGLINLVRKRPTADFQAHVQAGLGSWDLYRAEADVSGPLTESGNVRGRLVGAKQTQNSFMDAYGNQRDILYGVVETDLSETTTLRAGIDYSKTEADGAAGVPLVYSNGQPAHFSRSTSVGARWAKDEIETYNYLLNLEQKLPNDWSLNLAANYMDINRSDLIGNYLFKDVGVLPSLNQSTGNARADRGLAHADQTQRGLNVTLKGPWSLFGRTHDFSLGYNYSSYKNRHFVYSDGVNNLFNFYTWDNYLPRGSTYTPSFVMKTAYQQRGLFLANRFSLSDELHLILGARTSDYTYDYSLQYLTTTTRNSSKRRESGEVTPYAGLVYDLTPEQSVYFSYTGIFQPQSNQDRNGAVLAPVTGRNYETGWKGEFFNGALNANVAVYQIERDNLAELDTGYTVPGTSTSAYKAVKGAKTKGYDLELNGALTPDWNLSGSFTHAVTRDADGERSVTTIPVDMFKLWSTYHLRGDWSPITVGAGMNWNGPTYVTFSSTKIRQDDYAVVNAMARYQITHNLSATLNLNNLFDKTYLSSINGAQGLYGNPRNFMLSARYDF
ncbi:MAG: Ferric-pseudobactin 358 receptor [Pseudomonas citronellolis]|nr:MAG: Ferric-pseudobactin 358 receptor [Pseudomonas citronellolis]